MEASAALSIAASVLRIVTISVEAAKTLNDIQCAWKRAPVTVSSLCSQLKLTAASLSQVQSLLLSDIDILNNKPDLVETFDTTLTASVVLSSWLEEYVQTITKGVLEDSKATWKMKFKTLWNENEVKELSQQLQTQQGAITTLVALLQMDSIIEIRTRVRRQEALLQQIASNTRFLRRRHSINAPESILGKDKDSGSIFSKFENNERSFGAPHKDGYESVVLNTKVYSKAFNRVLDSSKDDELHNVRTIIEEDTVGDEASYKPSVSNLMEVSDTMASAVKNLNIDNVAAFSYRLYAARNSTELTLVPWQGIENIRKIDTSQYWGQIPYLGGENSPPKTFQRKKVTVTFELLKAFVVHANCNYAPSRWSRPRYLKIRKGDSIYVHKPSHTPMWIVSRAKGNARTAPKTEYVWVDMIEIDGSLCEDIDVLLRYFSRPYPQMDKTGSEGFQDQVRKILQNTGEKDMVKRYGRISAHCSSVAELKLFASEYRRWIDEKDQGRSNLEG